MVFCGIAKCDTLKTTLTQQVVSQFATIKINEFKNSHDRFIIIDNKTVYHFGASLKDLGKKWFAFSKMDIGAIDMFTRLEGMKVDGVKQ